NGFTVEAIDHALRAHDFDFAACLLGPQCEQWMRRGEVALILKYLDQLPTAQSWQNWSMALWYGWTYVVRGEIESAERWVNRLDELIMPLIQAASQKEGALIPVDL